MKDTPRPDTREGPLHRQAGGVSVWHPENLDVGALVESWGQRVAEAVLWLGHCVYTGLADDARCRDTQRVPLRADYLRNIIGRHHLDAVRQAALQAGYVDRHPSYRAGVHSQGYGILPPYDRARLVMRPITDHALRRNIRRWCEARLQAMWERILGNETAVDAEVCLHLWRNLQRVRLDADIDFGSDFHPAHQIAVEKIRHGDVWLMVDNFGRLHTNMTNLSRKLRQFLSVEGDRLANVDISESQPLFVGLALATARNGEQPSGQGEGGGREQGAGRGRASHMMGSTMMDNRPHLEGVFSRERLPGCAAAHGGAP